MKLAELASRSGVSTASIKHYQRVGVLPRPRLLNTTTGSYGAHHLERLDLIRFCRERLALPLPVVGRLVGLIQDAGFSDFDLMGVCQYLAIERRLPSWAPDETPGASDGRAAEQLGTTGTGVPSPQPDPRSGEMGPRDVARQVRDALGWPELDDDALEPLSSALSSAPTGAAELPVQYLVQIARALEPLARSNLSHTRRADTRDGLALGVLRGVELQNRLLLAMAAVANAAAARRPDDETQ